MTGTPRRRRLLTLKGRRNLPSVAAWLLAALVKMMRRTFRLGVDDPHGFLTERMPWPCVIVLWHNRILFTADCFPVEMRQRAAVLVSASRDGEYATRVIRQFGLQVVRGSSSRRSFRALRELASCLDAGTSAILTVDGPRGPRYEPQRGAVALATLCDVPVVPVGLSAPRRWEARSWDRTQIPKPFSKVTLVIGTPMRLSRDRETACRELKEALMAVTDDRRHE